MSVLRQGVEQHRLDARHGAVGLGYVFLILEILNHTHPAQNIGGSTFAGSIDGKPRVVDYTHERLIAVDAFNPRQSLLGSGESLLVVVHANGNHNLIKKWESTLND